MIVWLGVSALAEDGDVSALTAGELRNNAYTLEKGSVTLHPLLRSHIGILPGLDAKIPFLGLLLGPRGSVEIAPVQSETLAVSIEPEFALGWGFRTRLFGANVRLTKGLGAHRLNLNAGGFYSRALDLETGDFLETAQVPFNVGFDLVPRDNTAWRFVVSGETLAIASGTASVIAGVNWNHAIDDTVRIALGGALLVGNIPEEARTISDNIQLPSVIVLPVPTIELWMRL